MQLSLHNGSSSGVTIISNIFIDYYMPHANGEFVKIYLYLLRCLNGGQTDLNLASVADVFNCTETDILRTLRYWETRKLVVLSGKDSQTSIDFLEPMIPSGAPVPLAERPMMSVSSRAVSSASMPEAASALEPEPQNPSDAPASSLGTETAKEDTAAAPASQKPNLSADRVRELQENEEVRQMLFIAEQYMGTTLSRSVTDELLYIYENLHFSVDLIDYLIEYCVSKGSGDIHYIKKVAFSWHESGIDTVTKAKQETTTYHRNYFTILKAFGITNRNPIPSEVNTINHWMKDYGFTMDILTEACARTVASTGKANFRYADKILSGWKEKGVRHLTDIQALDTLHRQLQVDRAEQKNRKKASAPNNFNNFQQRDYNYAELENQLLK